MLTFVALREPLGTPAGLASGPQAREVWKGAGDFVATALAGAGWLRQFPNVGLQGCVRQEAPLLYITNLQIQVRAVNFSPQALTHSLPLKLQQEREQKKALN